MKLGDFARLERAAKLATDRILEKGADDVFKPPIFSQSIENIVLSKKADEFRGEARTRAIKFLKAANLDREPIGRARRSLVAKDQNSFRQVAWLDPFDAVNYLSVVLLLYDRIEAARIPKAEGVLHSHRMADNDAEIFDDKFGYDSFRAKSSELSRDRVGRWKVVTDISNFFDRVGIHPLENHLKDIGCDETYVTLVREMLLLWAGDRRSFGVPVGSDASRILSEAILLNVDKKLLANEIVFIRYVDDFRIFADSRAEALKAVEILTNLLADEGLSLNSRKTEIFQILEPEEIVHFANRFTEGEHEKINLTEKIEVKKAIRVSGRSTISRFYREPGKEALRKIKTIPKDTIINAIQSAGDTEIEQQIKLVVKYFVYAEQDTELLKLIIDRKITSIFYIADALVKETDQFDSLKCEEIKRTVYGAVDWLKCAYPLQIPILRMSADPAYREPSFAQAIIDGHRQIDSMLFFREAISLGYPSLDRARLRILATEVSLNVPDFVRRAIYHAVKNHKGLTEAERRPLLKNMKQYAEDWFIQHI